MGRSVVPRLRNTVRSHRWDDPSATWVKVGGDLPRGRPWVGIDPSLAKLGIVATDGERTCWRIHKPPSSMAMPARLSAHRQLLHNFFSLLQQPELVVVEAPGYGAQHRGMDLGKLNGIVDVVIYDEHLEDSAILMAPNTLKKFVTNKGNAPKNLMIREVFRVWDFDAEDDNIADAFALAQAGMTISTGKARYAWQVAAVAAKRTGPASCGTSNRSID